MAKFKRLGPSCRAPDVRPGVISTGDVVEAPLSSGWAEDPAWEWMDRPGVKETLGALAHEPQEF